MMKTLRASLVSVVAGGLLLSVSSGMVAAQTPHPVIETTAVQSSVGVEGQYCLDVSGGQAFVPNGTQVPGLYCPPNTPPTVTAPALPNDWPDAGPNTGG